jgi:hypothetical protein
MARPEGRPVCGFVQRCWALVADELALQVLSHRNSQVMTLAAPVT